MAMVLSIATSYAQTPITVGKHTTLHGPEKGTLVIIGGGKHPKAVMDTIVAKAGGKDKARIVVVTNASGPDEDYHSATIKEFVDRIGKANVSVLNLKTIDEANDDKNLQALKNATGVYFTGGRQWRITDVYLNTKAHKYFNEVLERGGVIAGSSAGASVQGSMLWRGDTKGAHILIGDHTQGLGFLRYAAIDQHIFVRNRQNDLADFISAANKLIPDGQTKFIGIGIDEATAIVVQGDKFKVIGKSFVAVHGGKNTFGRSDSQFYLLQSGDSYDMAELKRINQREY